MMQPNYYGGYSNLPHERLVAARKLLVLLGVILVLLFAGVFIYRQIVFRVSKTDPNMNHVATATAFIKIYFNKPIQSQGLHLSYSSDFVEKYTINNKEIDLTLKDGALSTGKHYTITIDSVTSTSGSQIKNKSLSFTAQNIPANKIGKNQQQALINRQDKYPYSAQYINYVGFDTLLDSGLSNNQLTILKEGLYGFSNQLNQKFWTMTLIPNSLSVKIHNSESASLTDNYTFKVDLGNTLYTVQAVSDPINDTLQTQILDANGALVYDSINAHD